MAVSFMLNQHIYTIKPDEVPIDTSLLVFIRSHARLVGTKFMCLEGGCGACIVNISGLQSSSGESRSIAVNSCLWPVYASDGLQITTIEGIGSLKNDYHPIQKALYHFNGTQCGYCSPGMVMNMYSLLQANGGKISMQQVENSFGGNICRCTGYRPILDAFKSLAMDSCEADIEDLTLDLCSMNKNQGSCPSKKKCKKGPHGCGLGKFHPKDEKKIYAENGKMWMKPADLSGLLKILTTETIKSNYQLVAGNTAHGVYRRSNDITVFIDIKPIIELHMIVADESTLSFGGNVSLTELMETLRDVSAKYEFYAYALHVANHIDLIASVPVRNAGTIAGNLSTKHAHNEFQSDIFLLLETVGAKMNIVSTDGLVHLYSPKEYLKLNMQQKVILNVVFPKLPSKQYEFRSYKVMPRAQNAHAMVNAAFLFEFESLDAKKSVKSCQICYGGINPSFVHAEMTEKLLNGTDDLYTNENLEKAIKSLRSEIQPDTVLPDPSAEYRQNLAIALFYRFMLNTSPPDNINNHYKSGCIGLERNLSSGIQTYQSNEKAYPLTQPTLKYEGLIQCSGEAEYVNDLFSAHQPHNELWAAFVPATAVHSKIVQIDATKALEIAGVVAFFSAKDIPGENSFMPVNSGVAGINENEVIFLEVDSEVAFHGQPCGMIVARTMDIANMATKYVDIVYQKMDIDRPIYPSVFHWRENNEPNTCKDFTHFEFAPNTTKCEKMLGDQKNFKGNFGIGGQYHFTMEAQTTFCFPNDDGGLNLFCASHWLDITHVAISKCLKIPQSKIFASFKRLGGSYGAKISRVSQIACACALACHLTRQPVRFVMSLESNMTVFGKRYSVFSDYEATIDSMSGRILDFKTEITDDYGCSTNDDISGLMVDAMRKTCYARTTEWKVKVNRLLTDAPSTTWCRAPGTTEAMAILENLMEHIARETNLDPAAVRLNNLNSNGPLHKIFPEFLKDSEYYERKAQINEFNSKNRWRKKGIAVSVMTFPMIYVADFPAYIAIYHADGTVAVSHGGSEIGQGINTKVAQVVAYTLGIPLSYVTITPHNSIISANRSLTGAAITSESICMAAKKACERILERLKPVRDKMPGASWVEIVQKAWDKHIDLTEKQIFYKKDAKTYNVVGCACAEIELDVLTGNVQILRVDIVEDTGNSMNPLVDVGQIEGAFMMGVGYWLTEKLEYDRQTGELVTNRTWTYKVPGAKDIPIDFRIKFLQGVNSDGIFGSKATGEPPLTLSIVVQFALRHAIDAVRLDSGKTEKWFSMGSGNTPDIIFDFAEVNVEDFKLN